MNPNLSRGPNLPKICGLFLKSLMVLMFLITVSLTIPAFAAEDRFFSANTASFSGELRAGEKNFFAISLEKNTVAQFSLEVGDRRVRLKIEDPGGEEIFKAIYLPGGAHLPAILIDRGGIYRIEIHSPQTGEGEYSTPVSYKMEFMGSRDSSGQDEAVFEAERKFQAAGLLRADWTRASLEKALFCYAQSAKISEDLRDWDSAARAYLETGEIYAVFGDNPKSLEFLERALAGSVAGGSSNRKILEITARLIEIELLLGDTVKARKLLSQMERDIFLLESPDDRISLNAILNNRFGDLHAVEGDLGKSRIFFDQALELWKQKPDRRAEANCLLNLGYIKFDGGEVLEAENNFRAALEKWDAAGDLRGRALTLTALAHVYLFFNQWDKALEFHWQSKELFARFGDLQGKSVALQGLGNLYEFLGLFKESAEAYKEALSINRQLNNLFFATVAEFALARTLKAGNETEQARALLLNALESSRRLNIKRVEIYISADLAEIAAENGFYAEALEKYLEIIPYLYQIKDLRGVAVIENRMGHIHFKRRAFSKAESYYRRALRLNRRLGKTSGVSDGYFYLSRIGFEKKELTRARELIDRSLKGADASNDRILSTNLRLADRSSTYEKVQLEIEVLMSLYRKTKAPNLMIEAFERVERSRGAILRDNLNRSLIDPRMDPAADLAKREKQLQNQIAVKIEEQLARKSLTEEKNQKHTPGDPGQLIKELNDLQIAYDRLQIEINSAVRKPALDEGQGFADVEFIRQSLADEETETIYLCYFLGKSRSYLWYIDKAEIKAFELASENEIEDLVRKFYQHLTATKMPYDPGLELSGINLQTATGGGDADFCSTGSALSDLLLGQVKNLIPGKRLLISPDGSLNTIPFEALPFSTGLPGELNSGCRFIDEEPDYSPLLLSNETVYVPSYSFLRTLRADRRAAEKETHGLLLIADPVYERLDPRFDKLESQNSLPGSPDEPATPVSPANLQISRLLNTGIEARRVAEFFAEKDTRLATGFEARRELLVEGQAENFRYLHLAVHGFFNDERPQFSGLLLSKFDSDRKSIEPVLSIQDIFSLKLNADLVVLSACETGLGEKSAGEGMTGIRYAVLSTGAKSAILTFWSVPDASSSRLMEEFYRNFAQGNVSTGEALRRAKIAVFEKRGWKNPRFWAAFSLNGEYDLRAAPPNETGRISADFNKGSGKMRFIFYFIAALSAGIALIFFLFRRFRKNK